MLQICVLDQNIQGKQTSITFLKLFLSAMIRNIKIHYILDVIEISKYIKLNKCIHNLF
jgi:hypothetical protein